MGLFQQLKKMVLPLPAVALAVRLLSVVCLGSIKFLAHQQSLNFPFLSPFPFPSFPFLSPLAYFLLSLLIINIPSTIPTSQQTPLHLINQTNPTQPSLHFPNQKETSVFLKHAELKLQKKNLIDVQKNQKKRRRMRK